MSVAIKKDLIKECHDNFNKLGVDCSFTVSRLVGFSEQDDWDYVIKLVNGEIICATMVSAWVPLDVTSKNYEWYDNVLISRGCTKEEKFIHWKLGQETKGEQ